MAGMEGLHYPRPCGCKGIRTCLVCEGQHDVHVVRSAQNQQTMGNHLENLWRYCYLCGRVHPPPPAVHRPSKQETTQATPQQPRGKMIPECPTHHADHDQGFVLPGIQVVPDFITDKEEMEMVHIIEQSPWKPSQSGRFKQDYGPKPNFKRRKVKQGGFSGLPSFSRPFVSRMTQLQSLQDFIPVEQCHLEYTPDRGSAIDLHFDDFWLWGNRLVTINLLSDTFLLLSRDADGSARGSKQISNGLSYCSEAADARTKQSEVWLVDELLIPMPRRSLLVLSDAARYKWKHAIPREAIVARRIAVTLRELALDFLPGGDQEAVGQELLDIALTYEGSVVQ